MKIFLIGPGGVGKSTSGKILAKKLGYKLVDLDLEFMNRVGHISSFIESFGYKKYASRNSKLFYSLLANYKDDTLFVLSSGFLVHTGLEDLISKHAKTLNSSGISILLLPSKDIEETVKIVVNRQIKRGIGLEEESERKKIIGRYAKYLEFGDIKIFSKDNPDAIAEEMFSNLVSRL